MADETTGVTVHSEKTFTGRTLDDVFDTAERLNAEKNYIAAEEKYSEFIRLCRSNGSCSSKRKLACALNNRGQLKYLKVDFDAAIADYTEAIDVDEYFLVPYYNRGQIHYRLGRYKKAESDLKEAVKLDSNFEDAKLNLQAILHLKQ